MHSALREHQHRLNTEVPHSHHCGRKRHGIGVDRRGPRRASAADVVEGVLSRGAELGRDSWGDSGVALTQTPLRGTVHVRPMFLAGGNWPPQNGSRRARVIGVGYGDAHRLEQEFAAAGNFARRLRFYHLVIARIRRHRGNEWPKPASEVLAGQIWPAGEGRDNSRLTPEYGYGTLAVFSSGGYGGNGLAPTRFPPPAWMAAKKSRQLLA